MSRGSGLRSTTHLTLAVSCGGLVALRCLHLQAIDFSNSTNVTLLGLTVDYDPLPFTQGTVMSVAQNLSQVDIALHPGYVSPFTSPSALSW